MIRVSVVKQSNYPVGVANIKKKLAGFLVQRGIVSPSEVSVAIVGEAKMKELSRKYLKDVHGNPDRSLHNVLSFTPEEVKGFVYPPDGTIYLGEIAVCYQRALEEAKEENVLIDDRIYELVEHGALHLLGIHHAE